MTNLINLRRVGNDVMRTANKKSQVSIPCLVLNLLPVEQEVAVLYALTRGYLDDIAVEAVSRFEQEFLAYLGNEGKEALDTLLKEKALTPEVEELLKKHIAKFKEGLNI